MNTALNRTSLAFLTNKSGGDLNYGDVVVLDNTNDNGFTTTTTAGLSANGLGVIFDVAGIANNATGAVAIAGWCPQINLDGAATVGQLIKTTTVAGQGTPHDAPQTTGDFAWALTASATPSAMLFGSPNAAAGSGTVTNTGTLTSGLVIVGNGGVDVAPLAAGSDGDVLTQAAGVASWATPSATAFWTDVIAAMDQDVASSTTPANDNELFFTMAANTMYQFEAYIVYGSPAGGGTPDLKYAFTGPATLTGLYVTLNVFDATDTSTNIAGARPTLGTTTALGTSATPRMANISGWAYSTTGGSGSSGLIFQWAQNTSNVNATRRYAGSVLRYRALV